MLYCNVCGDPIDPDDSHYEMPDGDIVCDGCLEDWADKYHMPAVVDLWVEEGTDDV